MHLLLALALTLTSGGHHTTTPHRHHHTTHHHHHTAPVRSHGPVRVSEPAPVQVHGPVRTTEPAPVIAEPVIQHRGGPVVTICATPDGGTTEHC